MTEIASLKISVDAKEANNAVNILIRLEQEAKNTEKSVKDVSKSSSALNKVLGLTAGLLSARQVLQAAESWTTLNNRLRLVTDSAEAFNSAQENIFRIAQDTRQGLTATAELYQRIATNQKELGITGQETADIVKTINQALVVSGTSGAGAEAALVQLGQAFASGTLRGEELNAVLEQAPALAQAIARGMGVTVGQLRALGAEGVLTADAVVKSLQSQAQAVEDQFATMAPTVSGALTQLDNSFIQLIGRMDESTGASANASEAISKLAAVLSDPRTIEAANNLAAGLATAFTAIIEAARDVVTGVQWMAEEVAVAMGGIGGHDIERLEEEATRLQNLLGKMQARGEADYAMYGSMVKDLDEVNAKIEMYYQLQSEAPKEPVAQTLPQTPVLKEASAQIEQVTKKTTGLTDAQRAMAKASEDLARAQQSNNEVISDLAEQLYQATLGAGELAKRQNELRLNEYATPDQIAQVRSLSDELAKLKATEDARQALAPVMQDLQVGNSGNAELDRLMLEQQQKRDVLMQARATEAMDEAAHAEAMVLLDQQTAMRRKEILDQQTASQQEAALSSAASIVSITQAQVGQLQTLFEEGSAAGRAFFLVTQALAAANAIVQGIQAGMAIRVAYAQMAAMSGPAAPAVLAAGEVHANVATGMGFASAAMIAAQTVASFDGGGFTGGGARAGGLDGKGGFMAMVHPNETIIDHTKGQQMPSSGAQVVNNFAISGQVDRRTQSQIAGKMAQEQQRSRARFEA